MPLQSLSALVILSTLLFACGEEEIEWAEPPPATPSGQPQAKSADRLPPGELLEGPEEEFGFSFPKGMKLSRPTSRSVRASGRVDFDQLTDYVRERIATRHAELLNDKLVFPNSRIKGVKDRIFELTVQQHGRIVHLDIHDKTPRPTTQGLTEKQRWKQVGLKPSGGLIDPHAME